MIVVDVGAMTHGTDQSVAPLIERFQPELLFAFDPHPDFVEGVERIDGTLVVSRRAAAWISDTDVSLKVDGMRTGAVKNGTGDRWEEAFNLASWLRTLPLDHEEVVLKLDAEGAEYLLLRDVCDQGLDTRLARVLVEWHSPEKAHGWHTERLALRCPLEAWA